MDTCTVNCLLKTPGDASYHSDDSHYPSYYAEYGNKHQINVALGSCGESPRGIADKIASSDMLHMAETLNTKVMISLHHDI